MAPQYQGMDGTGVAIALALLFVAGAARLSTVKPKPAICVLQPPAAAAHLAEEELHGAQVAGARSLHQRRAAALALVLQLGAGAQQQLRHVRVPVLARVRQRRVAGLGLGVHVRAHAQQVPAGERKTMCSSHTRYIHDDEVARPINTGG